MELGALVLPHVNYVLQVGDGQLIKALPQKVQYFVSGQGLHLYEVLGEDLEQADNQIINYMTKHTELRYQRQQTESRDSDTFIPSSGQIFNTQGENSKMMLRFSTPVSHVRSHHLPLMDNQSYSS